MGVKFVEIGESQPRCAEPFAHVAYPALVRIGHDKELAAVAEARVSELDRVADTAELGPS